MNSIDQPRILNPRPHNGSRHELIIGIDVGTTFSGVCYAFLRPGEVPQIQTVTKFTDQTTGDKKIPSVLYYDHDMNMRAAGASAVVENVIHEAESEEWFKVQYFKMHLRPSNMVLDTHGLEIRDPPYPKTGTDIMGDFLGYLYSETIKYIKSNQLVDGSELLGSVSDRIKFVLSHPNGWAGLPQQRMREAAVLGGLVKNYEDSLERISFVSEGEASALSCLAGGFCSTKFERGFRFMIADLGGGTLDMTSYEVTNSSPLQLRELTSSDCRFAGSVFVNKNARKLIQRMVRGSQYDNPEILDEVIDCHFEEVTKRQFKDSSKVSWLRISDLKENDPGLGIRRGRLRVDGKDIADCFNHSVSEAVKSIKEQIRRCNRKAMPVWLVGGFAASDWLSSKLEEALSPDGIDVRRPSIDLAKAVAHGNVLYSLERTVQSRFTRATYGVSCSTAYVESDPDHRRRKHLKYTNPSGSVLMPGIFDTIVNKNTSMEETKYLARPFYREVSMGRSAEFESDILLYDEKGSVPIWYDENKDKFSVACTIRGDLSRLCRKSDLQTHNGKRYWDVNYEIELMFGMTELKARYKWEEDGKTKYGPATIFYEEQEVATPPFALDVFAIS